MYLFSFPMTCWRFHSIESELTRIVTCYFFGAVNQRSGNSASWFDVRAAFDALDHGGECLKYSFDIMVSPLLVPLWVLLVIWFFPLNLALLIWAATVFHPWLYVFYTADISHVFFPRELLLTSITGWQYFSMYSWLSWEWRIVYHQTIEF